MHIRVGGALTLPISLEEEGDKRKKEEGAFLPLWHILGQILHTNHADGNTHLQVKMEQCPDPLMIISKNYIHICIEVH